MTSRSSGTERAVRTRRGHRLSMRSLATTALVMELLLLTSCSPLPSWVTWQTDVLKGDLTGNDHDETICVADGVAEVVGICATPDDWKVQKALLGDVDRNGDTELVLIAWRRGSYGDSAPFWAERDDDWSQHVFILHVRNEGLEPQWMSSAVGMEISDAQLDNQGRLLITDRQGTVTTWSWGTWGLELEESRSTQGT